MTICEACDADAGSRYFSLETCNNDGIGVIVCATCCGATAEPDIRERIIQRNAGHMNKRYLAMVQEHLYSLDLSDWQQEQHKEAWLAPRPREQGIRHMIMGYAQMCDAYRDDPEDGTELGQDGYFHEHARDMVLAMLAALNLDVTGRFSCQQLARLIRKLAEASGVELPP